MDWLKNSKSVICTRFVLCLSMSCLTVWVHVKYILELVCEKIMEKVTAASQSKVLCV